MPPASEPGPVDATIVAGVAAERSFASGRYVLRRVLPEGGQKTVYVVHDTKLDRECALSMVRSELLEPDDLERFRREAQAMARLDHANIVSVYDFGEEDGRPFFVCQYVAGGDLRQELEAAAGPLPMERALSIAADLCRALAHAHEHGIVHRDVKPANVLLAGDGTAKLGDLGLATAGDHSRLTLAGTFVGTAAYMAPEQAMGQPADARSDLYALGCVLYETFTGRPPFLGEDAVGVISQHIHTAPVAPSWHNPEVSKPLENLILRLLAKAPSDRPGSAQDVAAELRRIVDRPAVELPSAAQPQAATDLRGLNWGFFVGRGEEMDALKDALEHALSGKGSLAMLVGEPGIGKTRLAEEFGVYAALRGAQVLTGHCYEGEASLPYRPFVEAFRQYTRSRSDEDLRLQLGPGAPEIATLVSEIRTRLPNIEEAPKLEPEDQRLRLFESVTEFLRNASTAQPLVLHLEDLHWADKPSLLLLQHLMQQTARERLLVLGTYRDIELDRTHPLADALGALRRLPNYRRVLLRGLPQESVLDLLTLFDPSEDGAAGRQALAAALFKETEGNPFFIREVIAHLVETGKIVREEGRWTPRVTSISELGIPEGVREVIGRRLSRLSDACNRMLTLASTMTGGFTWDALKAINADVPEAELLDLLEEALAAQLISERKEAGAGRYEFTHALIRQTLYEELSTPRRVLLHRQIGEALEKLYAANLEPHLAELAHHFYQAAPGGGVEKAIEYAIRAGDRARELFAWEEAVEHYQRALEAMELVGGERDQERAKVLLLLGDCQRMQDHFAECLVSTRQAAELARRLHAPELFADAAIQFDGVAYYVEQDLSEERLTLLDEALAMLEGVETAQRVHVLCWRVRAAAAAASARTGSYVAGFSAYAGVKDPAVLEQAREALALAERLHNQAAVVAACDVLHGYGWTPDNLAERLSLAERWLEAARQDGSVSSMVSALATSTNSLLESGYIPRLRARLNELTAFTERTGYQSATPRAGELCLEIVAGDLRLAEQHQAGFASRFDTPDAIITSVGQLAFLRFMQGRFHEMATVWGGVVQQYPGLSAFAAAFALIHAHGGSVAEARLQIDRVIAGDVSAIPRDFMWQTTLNLLADACAEVAHDSAAGVLYDALLPYAHTNATTNYLIAWGSMARVIARLATMLERYDEAEQHFETALVANDRMGFHAWTAWTRLNYGDMLLRRSRQGDPAAAASDRDRAVALLQQALAFGKESGMGKVERDSERLLASA